MSTWWCHGRVLVTIETPRATRQGAMSGGDGHQNPAYSRVHLTKSGKEDILITDICNS